MNFRTMQKAIKEMKLAGDLKLPFSYFSSDNSDFLHIRLREVSELKSGETLEISGQNKKGMAIKLSIIFFWP